MTQPGRGVRAPDMLPLAWRAGRFLGRLDIGGGPTPVLIIGGVAYDMSRVAPTVAELIAKGGWEAAKGDCLGDFEALLHSRFGRATEMLSPVDLQCIKASGVTFAVSALERVIEERARGNAVAADALRSRLEAEVGGSLRAVAPGSSEANKLRSALIDAGMWSQYLEVAIGPDAEIFTKAAVLSTVGWGAQIGVRSDSAWNNSEPEVVLVVSPDGVPVGATLGNDVNLRDFEGRSALLLGKAKDNNASCSIGPLIRLFDDGFGMKDICSASIDLLVEGQDGYRLRGSSSMSQISRPPAELVRQALSEHQYPDGFVLFLGTMFAPTQDRNEIGSGFTHNVGDVVTISTRDIGTLKNSVTTSKVAPPWRFGVVELMRNLAERGLLSTQKSASP